MFVFSSSHLQGQSISSSSVRAIGALRTVMKDNDRRSTIYLDTISNKKHLYAVGPLNGLTGEITIIDGESYISQVDRNGKITITNTFEASAPFLVYGAMPSRVEYEMSDSISDLRSLEKYLSEVYRKRNETPFPFEIRCHANAATIHIVNSRLNDPSDHSRAHDKINFQIKNKAVIVVGFYSAQHKGIFTHHDSNMHLHLITEDKTLMGHVDDLHFSNAVIMLPR